MFESSSNQFPFLNGDKGQDAATKDAVYNSDCTADSSARGIFS
jgi:hypothetical protein